MDSKNAINQSRLNWDIAQGARSEKYSAYWQQRQCDLIPAAVFTPGRRIFLEIGAGTGAFCSQLAEENPDAFVIAMERCRMRAKRLVHKTKKSERANLLGIRGNAIPAVIGGIPSATLERIYILYPCPWPRSSQRRNRWYLHPIMPHLVRILRPGGLLIWASDQEFYIREAQFVLERTYPLSTLKMGEVAPNEWNSFAAATGGRTKFERTFLAAGQPCFELISKRMPDTIV